MSSLTADITDTNFLLDDLLHQLALHSDYALLKSIKHAYADIHHASSSQQSAIKRSISQLTANIDELQDEVSGTEVAELKARKEGVQGGVREKEAEVVGLKGEEARLRAEVEAREEEAAQLEHRRKDRVKRHHDRMQSNKSHTPHTGAHTATQTRPLLHPLLPPLP